jgi:gliding motility-associated-like protein
MKKYASIVILLFNFCLSFSQNLDWVRTVKYTNLNPGNINIDDVCTDISNYQYSISSGNNLANFSFNGNPIYASNSNVHGAIIKSNPAGSHIWIKFFTPLSPNATCVPKKILYSNGYIYVAGINNGSIDMDPGGDVNFLNGTTSPFVVKLDTAGNFIWAKSFGSVNAKVNDLKVDNFGNVFITGSFNTNFTFNNLSYSTLGDDDIYILKFNNLGQEMWCNTYGSNSFNFESGKSIALDANGDILVCGYFAGTVNFNPTGTAFNLSSSGQTDGFISKISATGAHISTVKIGGIDNDRLNSIEILNNYIYLTGQIYGSVDMDPGPLTYNVTTPLGSTPGFLLKLDTQFNMIWNRIIPTTSNSVGQFLKSHNNAIYISGIMVGTTDLNPDLNLSHEYVSNGNGANSYVVKFNENGSFIWGAGFVNTESAFMIGNYGYENYPNGISVTNEAVYIAGGFKGAVDFNPDPTVTQNTQSALTPTGIGVMSGFLVKLNNCQSNGSSISISQCQSYTWPENNITYTNSGVYTQTLTNINGCDSVITLNLTIMPAQTNVVSITQCDYYTSPIGNIYSTSGSYSETYTNIYGCDSIVTINLIITNLQNTVSISSCGTYISPLGNSYSSSGTYQEIYSTQTGCDSTVNILLTVNNVVTVNQSITACSNYFSPTGINYTQSGQYYDTLSTISGCDSIIMTQLTIVNPTTSSISPVVCNSYSSPSGNIYYQTGTYIDTIQNVIGCDSIITINLSVVGTLNVNAGPNLNVCLGNSIVLTATGATNYVWSNGISNGIAFTPSLTDYYFVTGTDGNGCLGQDSVLVTVYNPPTISFNYILPDCEGGLTGSINTQTNGANPISYQWSTGSTNQNLQDVSAGAYNLIVIDGNGCSENQNFNLPDGVGDCLLIPTGFTPNGDNQNDTWQIIGIENFAKNNVQVFNRWGQKVFESQGTTVNWSGKYKDEMLPIADYYFVVDLGNGQVFNGTVTLKY